VQQQAVVPPRFSDDTLIPHAIEQCERLVEVITFVVVPKLAHDRNLHLVEAGTHGTARLERCLEFWHRNIALELCALSAKPVSNGCDAIHVATGRGPLHCKIEATAQVLPPLVSHPHGRGRVARTLSGGRVGGERRKLGSNRLVDKRILNKRFVQIALARLRQLLLDLKHFAPMGKEAGDDPRLVRRDEPAELVIQAKQQWTASLSRLAPVALILQNHAPKVERRVPMRHRHRLGATFAAHARQC
jgi:hypothetical protein